MQGKELTIGRKQAFKLLIYSKVDLHPEENCKPIEEHRHLTGFLCAATINVHAEKSPQKV